MQRPPQNSHLLPANVLREEYRCVETRVLFNEIIISDPIRIVVCTERVWNATQSNTEKDV